MIHVHVVKTIAPQVTIQERVIGEHGRPPGQSRRSRQTLRNKRYHRRIEYEREPPIHEVVQRKQMQHLFLDGPGN